jgi:hypothetical protein
LLSLCFAFAGRRDEASPRMRATRLKPMGGAERRSGARREAEPWEMSESKANPRMRVIEVLLRECMAGVQTPARRSRAAASRALVVRVTLTQRSASLDAPRWALGGSPAIRACSFSGFRCNDLPNTKPEKCGSPIVQAVVSWKKVRERPNLRPLCVAASLLAARGAGPAQRWQQAASFQSGSKLPHSKNYALAFLNSSISAGTISNRLPTTP